MEIQRDRLITELQEKEQELVNEKKELEKVIVLTRAHGHQNGIALRHFSFAQKSKMNS